MTQNIQKESTHREADKISPNMSKMRQPLNERSIATARSHATEKS